MSPRFLAIFGVLLLSAFSRLEAVPISAVNLSSNFGQGLTITPGVGTATLTFGDEDTDNDNFDITGQLGGAGALGGLSGDLNGTFTFGDPLGSTSVALTSVGGTFTIDDGAGFVFSSDIDLIELAEGFVNSIAGTILISGVSYGGANLDLLELAAAPSGLITLSFQKAAGAFDLDDLFANGGGPISYSGTLAPVPEPASLTLIGTGLLGAAAIRRRRKARSKAASR